MFLPEAAELAEPFIAVDRERFDLVTELRAVPDVVLRRVTFGELRKHFGQLRVDGGTVIALHEVLDDELPVGLDVIGDPTAHLQLIDGPAADDRVSAESFGDVRLDGVLRSEER